MQYLQSTWNHESRIKIAILHFCCLYSTVWSMTWKKEWDNWSSSSCPTILFAMNFLLWVFTHILTDFYYYIWVCFQIPTLTCLKPSGVAPVMNITNSTRRASPVWILPSLLADCLELAVQWVERRCQAISKWKDRNVCLSLTLSHSLPSPNQPWPLGLTCNYPSLSKFIFSLFLDLSMKTLCFIESRLVAIR